MTVNEYLECHNILFNDKYLAAEFRSLYYNSMNNDKAMELRKDSAGKLVWLYAVALTRKDLTNLSGHMLSSSLLSDGKELCAESLLQPVDLRISDNVINQVISQEHVRLLAKVKMTPRTISNFGADSEPDRQTSAEDDEQRGKKWQDVLPAGGGYKWR